MVWARLRGKVVRVNECDHGDFLCDGENYPQDWWR